ncbi:MULTISPECIES: prepilin-type N-terminal cleavage/methylation domain-containing protein [unclassified Paenibacillus]|uniref:prepilin-type N-terminal cleavage/methylation domain-containing protein n=1 Tax=unclassified Paenibacillus TaxID=185978 RepID=UPI002406DAF8|nr:MULTISPECIES: prepilin-type N-terminal cleavage/methylation domain-containing protein [unclassified Paenibacillus]MDF9840163.1 prepilin-type N-terminal cleavage/methylation domain-containing protein [Paenibacillus sp. PastF-2]MDF9846745.1 prepilin-type N-terminal cleavage/methylation domain-containing protein [Paenibacillus sp. PastM-2]MDF9852906.1 prepilin-type N-terminal cleavage/methylation domain-containing protein [Paenibacillus sp. PastF-1]MDH6478589.1 prepilin-type N-terminal cleavage
MSGKDKHRLKRVGERGFTLIEVLAAIVILSIVSLVLTSYFSNALSYSKSNQNKTIMVNLARNALFYMEKQDYQKLNEYFQGKKAEGATPEIPGHPSINAAGCVPLTSTTVSCSLYSNAVKDVQTLANVLNPTINGIAYHIDIEYQAALHSQMSTSRDPVEAATAKYLLPVRVRVKDSGKGGANVRQTVVEGYITDETIR